MQTKLKLLFKVVGKGKLEIIKKPPFGHLPEMKWLICFFMVQFSQWTFFQRQNCIPHVGCPTQSQWINEHTHSGEQGIVWVTRGPILIERALEFGVLP